MTEYAPAALRELTDEQLEAEFRGLAFRYASGTEGALRLVTNEMQSRLSRRQLEATVALELTIKQLERSSERWETLTRRLLIITVLLLIAAAPPALEAVLRWIPH